MAHRHPANNPVVEGAAEFVSGILADPTARLHKSIPAAGVTPNGSWYHKVYQSGRETVNVHYAGSLVRVPDWNGWVWMKIGKRQVQRLVNGLEGRQGISEA